MSDILQTLKKENHKLYLNSLGIEKMRLFGSFAKWEQNENSDIDFLYKYNSELKTTSRWIWNAYWYLENLFHKKVDLVSIDAIDNFIEKEVWMSKKIVF